MWASRALTGCRGTEIRQIGPKSWPGQWVAGRRLESGLPSLRLIFLSRQMWVVILPHTQGSGEGYYIKPATLSVFVEWKGISINHLEILQEAVALHDGGGESVCARGRQFPRQELA